VTGVGVAGAGGAAVAGAAKPIRETAVATAAAAARALREWRIRCVPEAGEVVVIVDGPLGGWPDDTTWPRALTRET
jgi:hypothetical protein